MENTCKCPHHKVTPVLVVLFGLTFLLGSFDILTADFINVAWPVIVIAAGLMKLGEKAGMCKCC